MLGPLAYGLAVAAVALVNWACGDGSKPNSTDTHPPTPKPDSGNPEDADVGAAPRGRPDGMVGIDVGAGFPRPDAQTPDSFVPDATHQPDILDGGARKDIGDSGILTRDGGDGGFVCDDCDQDGYSVLLPGSPAFIAEVNQAMARGMSRTDAEQWVMRYRHDCVDTDRNKHPSRPGFNLYRDPATGQIYNNTCQSMPNMKSFGPQGDNAARVEIAVNPALNLRFEGIAEVMIRGEKYLVMGDPGFDNDKGSLYFVKASSLALGYSRTSSDQFRINSSINRSLFGSKWFVRGNEIHVGIIEGFPRNIVGAVVVLNANSLPTNQDITLPSSLTAIGQYQPIVNRVVTNPAITNFAEVVDGNENVTMYGANADCTLDLNYQDNGTPVSYQVRVRPENNDAYGAYCEQRTFGDLGNDGIPDVAIAQIDSTEAWNPHRALLFFGESGQRWPNRIRPSELVGQTTPPTTYPRKYASFTQNVIYAATGASMGFIRLNGNQHFVLTSNGDVYIFPNSYLQTKAVSTNKEVILNGQNPEAMAIIHGDPAIKYLRIHVQDDVNGDGIADLIVTAAQFVVNGSIRVFSGTQLYSPQGIVHLNMTNPDYERLTDGLFLLTGNFLNYSSQGRGKDIAVTLQNPELGVHVYAGGIAAP